MSGKWIEHTDILISDHMVKITGTIYIINARHIHEMYT